MAKYILNKHQIKRLIDGKHVIDGHGRKLIAGENVKGVLQKIDVDADEVMSEYPKFLEKFKK